MLTVDRLNELMPTLYLGSELSGIGWDSLSDSDKTIMIDRADKYIRSAVLIENGAEDLDTFATDYEKAECCVVFDLLYGATNSRYDAIRAGLKSYSGPDVSESYADIKDVKVVGDDFKHYLWRYIYRGV